MATGQPIAVRTRQSRLSLRQIKPPLRTTPDQKLELGLGYTCLVTSAPVERYELRASRIGRRARLRPMQLGELFDLALRVYRALGWRIMLGSAVPPVFTLAGVA